MINSLLPAAAPTISMAISMAIALSIFSTTAQTVNADDLGSVTAQAADVGAATRLRDLPMHLNPQLGVSSFQYSSQGPGRSELTGGATIEFGAPIYRVETGFLIVRTSSSATWVGESERTPIHSNFLTLPVMWKARIFSTPLQSWSVKLGALQAFQLSSNKSEYTNRIDVLASLGVSGRLAFTDTTDFIVEASYNRGLMPALRTSSTDDFNEGILVLLGLSVWL